MSSLKPKSYDQILKSSVVVGGASFINILLGIVRTKFLAIWLGPAGVGVLGIYYSILQTAAALLGLGIGRSGVREIAEALGSGNEVRSARAILAIRRWSFLLALAGALLLILLRKPISQFSFHHERNASAIGWLGVGVFASIMSAGQLAVLQGTRRMRFLAMQSVIGSILGTIAGVLIVWHWRQQGIVWFIVAVTLTALASSSYFVRRIPVAKVALTWTEFGVEGRSLIRLGVMLMASGLLATGTMFLVRTIVNRRLGEAAAGYFQAAFSVSVVYLDFILQAMGADFYPRLTGAADDPPRCNQLVNEQLEIALLLAGPIILGMLSYSPAVVQLLYAKDFGPASGILRWQVLGTLLKVTAWPVGFILLARNQGLKFFACELVWNLTYLGTILLGLKAFGLAITGAGFVVAYTLLLLWVLFLARGATGFRLNSINRALFAAFLCAAVLIFLLAWLVRPWIFYAISSIVTAGCGGWALSKLYSVLGPERINAVLKKLTFR